MKLATIVLMGAAGLGIYCMNNKSVPVVAAEDPLMTPSKEYRWGMKEYNPLSHFMTADVTVRDALKYEVKDGDTYWELSRDYGVAVDELLCINGKNLRAGKSITIPELKINKGSLVITTPSSITLEDYVAEFKRLNSPFSAKMVYDECESKGVDPRFVMGYFRLECSLGANLDWVRDGTSNPANLKCTGTAGKNRKGFAIFNNYGEGIKAAVGHFAMHIKRGRVTLEQIREWDSPRNENDTDGNISFIRSLYGSK